MKNKKKQTAAVAMATALGVSAIMSPATVHAQGNDPAAIMHETTTEIKQAKQSAAEERTSPENEPEQTNESNSNAAPLMANNKIMPASTDVEINEATFPDALFRQYVINNFDTSNPKDGKLTASEISNITRINIIGFKDIKDITGIEYFTALEELYCSKTGISKLDISRNTFLKSLDCSETDISALDVSIHSNLEFLTCSDTKIKVLDVSKSLNLYQLICYNTEIKELKLDNNPALTILSCYKTKIKVLDVSKNTALETFMCSDTELKELIVKLNTKLKYLDCANTNIQKLDLNMNKDLSTLQCRNTKITNLDVSECKVLNTLDCSGTNINNLDVSKNGSLLNLDCRNNSNLTSLNVAGAINLGYLFCSNTAITSLDVSNNTNLIYLAAQNKSLAWLNVGNNTNLATMSKMDSSIDLAITGTTFKITDLFENINPQKITITNNNGSIDGDTGVVSGYTLGTPIIYTYDCGTIKNQPVILNVTLNAPKLNSKIKIPGNLDMSYTGSPMASPSVDKTGSLGVVTFAYETWNGNAWELFNDIPMNAGRYKVKVHLASDDFYNEADCEKEFTISQAANSWTDKLSIKGWTFEEKPNTPSAKAKFGKVITYTYSDSADGTFTDNVPTNAGTWYVKATIAGTKNYSNLESILSFTIKPKNIKDSNQIVIPEITNNKDLEDLVIKDGNKVLVEGTDYEVTKKQSGDKVTVTIKFKGNYTGTVTKTYTTDDKKPFGNTDKDKNKPSGNTDKDKNKPSDNTDKDKNKPSGNTDKDKNKPSDKNKAVQTGDTATVGLWASLMVFAAGTIRLLKNKKRKEETEE